MLKEPSLINFLTDKEVQVTAIQVRLNLPKEVSAANAEIVKAARKLREDLKQRFPDIKINLGGSAAAGVSLGEAVALDMSTLVIGSYVIIIIALLILLRSLRGMIACTFINHLFYCSDHWDLWLV